MTVLRVEGGSAVELARRQGELTARARGAQLEDDHAHVLARTGTAWDDVARRLLVEETARRAMDALDDESRTFFAAYAEKKDRDSSSSASRACRAVSSTDKRRPTSSHAVPVRVRTWAWSSSSCPPRARAVSSPCLRASSTAEPPSTRRTVI
ncbi:MAG: hypothetical protein EON52_07335, partial [Actinomycetales bacterium]